MALIYCIECGGRVSEKAAKCPSCGVPQLKEVSILWTLLFGCFYFFAKGWIKTGLVALLLSSCTFGLAWFVIPFFASKMVNAIEK